MSQNLSTPLTPELLSSPSRNHNPGLPEATRKSAGLDESLYWKRAFERAQQDALASFFKPTSVPCTSPHLDRGINSHLILDLAAYKSDNSHPSLLLGRIPSRAAQPSGKIYGSSPGGSSGISTGSKPLGKGSQFIENQPSLHQDLSHPAKKTIGLSRGIFAHQTSEGPTPLHPSRSHWAPLSTAIPPPLLLECSTISTVATQTETPGKPCLTTFSCGNETQPLPHGLIQSGQTHLGSITHEIGATALLPPPFMNGQNYLRIQSEDLIQSIFPSPTPIPANRKVPIGAPSRAPEPGIRLYVEWSGEGVRIWIGVNENQPIQLLQLAMQMKQWFARQGERLVALTCNGHTVWQELKSDSSMVRGTHDTIHGYGCPPSSTPSTTQALTETP